MLLLPLLIWTLFPNLTFYLIVWGFHRKYATGAACNRLVLSHFGNCMCSNVETNLSWTCLVSKLLSFERPSVLLFCSLAFNCILNLRKTLNLYFVMFISAIAALYFKVWWFWNGFLYARLQTGRIMVWWCPSIRPSVRPSFRPSGSPSVSHSFSHFLGHALAPVTYCDHALSGVCRPSSVVRLSSVCRPSSVRLFTFSTSSPEPLDGFWWNLVWMKYSRSLTSVVVFRPDPSRGGSRAGQK